MKTQKQTNRGFTLIELLVVIAIIAMLLSILMPALSAVKRKAQQVVCLSNLSHWGLILTLYTEDHDSHFFAGYYNYTDPNGVMHTSSNKDLWPYALEPYYEIQKFNTCPASRLSIPDIHNPSAVKEADGNLSGGYGLNGWLCDPPEYILQNQGHNTQNNWRTMDHLGSSKIPLMADAIWYTGLPESTDLPPEGDYENDPDSRYSFTDIESEATPVEPTNQMQRFTINRHKGMVNVLLMDGSVSQYSPKELWQLKWHQNYDMSVPLPEWPEWMKSFRDPR